MQEMPIITINVTLLWQMVNIAILVALFIKFLYKPIGKIIEKRRLQIEEELSDAEANRKDAKILQEKAEQALKETKQKTQEMLNEAVKKAEEIREDILKEAHASREKMMKSAEADISKMKEQVKSELRSEMTEVAVMLAEKMIGKKMDAVLEADLLDDFIEKVGE